MDPQDVPVVFGGTHSLLMDDKGRLTVVAAFRKVLGDKVVLRMNRSQKCIEILSPHVWNLFLRKLSAVSALDADVTNLITLMCSRKVDAVIDKQGRVLIPATMKQVAGIEGPQVVLTGCDDRLKVWAPSVWEEFERKELEEDLEARVCSKYGI